FSQLARWTGWSSARWASESHTLAKGDRLRRRRGITPPTYLGRGIRRRAAQPGGAERRCVVGVRGAPRHDTVRRAAELSAEGFTLLPLCSPPQDLDRRASMWRKGAAAPLCRAQARDGHGTSSLFRCGRYLVTPCRRSSTSCARSTRTGNAGIT